MKKSQLKILVKEIIKEIISNDDINSKTEHFSVKFGDPEIGKESAKIILNGSIWFANTFKLSSDYGRLANKWMINAHTGAFDMKFKSPNFGFKTVQELLDYLENWYMTNNQRLTK